MFWMHLKGCLKVYVVYRLALTVLIQLDHECDINSALNLDLTLQRYTVSRPTCGCYVKQELSSTKKVAPI